MRIKISVNYTELERYLLKLELGANHKFLQYFFNGNYSCEEFGKQFKFVHVDFISHVRIFNVKLGRPGLCASLVLILLFRSIGLSELWKIQKYGMMNFE